MTLLGDNTENDAFQEQFGLNVTNQIVTGITLPAGGPWRVYRIGTFLAGVGSDASAKLILMSAGGTLLRSSSTFTSAGRPFGLGQNNSHEMDITDYEVAGGTTLFVGFWRHPSDTVQHGYDSGGTHIHDTAGSAPESLGAWTSHAGKPAAWLYYELANTAPNAPTIDEPDQNEVVTDQTPVIDWTYSDPDGGSQNAYEVEIDNNSDFSSLVVNTGKVTSGTTSYTVGTTLTRGTTYYVRVRTWDSAGLVSAWSSTRTFKIAGTPTGTVTSPGTDTTAPLYYTAGSDTTPKLKPVWTFSCPNGGTQTSASVKVYDAAGTSLLHTHAHSGSALTASVSGFTPTNGTKYQIAVIVTCSHGVASAESGKKRCQVRWGRASYRGDLGAAPLTLSAVVSSTTNSGQVIMEYASSAATTPEPTDWKATIAEVTKQRYVWHRVTLLPQVAASPTSPALNSVVFSFSNNVLNPDNWNMSVVGSIDTGTFVYGTQSLRHDNNGSAQGTSQVVTVVPNTDYIFSGRIKTQGAAVAGLRLRDAATGTDLAVIDADPDTDWTRYATPVWNSGEATSVTVMCRSAGASGTTAWFDALKVEASTVVTPWTPGFLGQAVVLDAGGLQIDAAGGGVFRLRAADGEQVDLDDLAHIGTLGFAQVTAAQGSINSTTDVTLTGLSVTVNVGADRRIRITGEANFDSTVAGDDVGFRIYQDGSRIQSRRFSLDGGFQGASVSTIETPSAGSHTYSLVALRSAGTGTITMQAQSDFPAYILVEDIGPA
jgi:hypothetical protein